MYVSRIVAPYDAARGTGSSSTHATRMGLDWNPLGRPKPGHEEEFARLFREIGEMAEAGVFERLGRRLRGVDPEAVKKRWLEIQVSPLETVGAPRVGQSAEATAWALERWREQPEPKPSQEEFLRGMEGYWVVDLAPPSDGIPPYSNGGMGYTERTSFRAEFLRDCEDVLHDEETLERCYESCLAADLAVLGRGLRTAAESYARANDVLHVEHVRSPDGFEEGSPESKAHIVFAAARWCEWWSSRGHGLEADW
jgi:hypothetical protein